MKQQALILALVLGSCQLSAYQRIDTSKPYKDIYGHTYRDYNTLDKDNDGDGVTNRYDYDDNDKQIQYKWQRNWNKENKW